MCTFQLGGVLFLGTLTVMTSSSIQLCEGCNVVGLRLGTYSPPCAVDRCPSCCTACRHVFQESFLLKSQNPSTRFTYPSQKSKHDIWNLAYVVICRSAGRPGTVEHALPILTTMWPFDASMPQRFEPSVKFQSTLLFRFPAHLQPNR